MHVGDLNGTEQKGGREAFRKKEEEEEQSSVPLMADLRARQLQENQLKFTGSLDKISRCSSFRGTSCDSPYLWMAAIHPFS